MKFTDAIEEYFTDMRSAGRINSARTEVSYRGSAGRSMSAACATGKRVYYSERLATRAVNVAGQRGELPPMRHYPCQVCGWWHLARKVPVPSTGATA